MPSSPSYKRDYKQENSNDSAARKKKRAQNNKANRLAGTYGNNDGKDVAHKDNNTNNNSKSNLSIQSESSNRSFARTSEARRKKIRGKG